MTGDELMLASADGSPAVWRSGCVQAGTRDADTAPGDRHPAIGQRRGEQQRHSLAAVAEHTGRREPDTVQADMRMSPSRGAAKTAVTA